MPISGAHDLSHSNDVVIINSLVKEVTHRIDEDHPRGQPPEWFGELFWYDAKVKPALVRMSAHPSKSLCEGFRIAMRTTRANFRTTPNRVPCCVSPFYRGTI